MYRSAFHVAFLFLLTVSQTIKADDTARLHMLFDEFYSWRLEDTPEFATSIGSCNFNDKVNSYNVTKMHERYSVAVNFKSALDSINSTRLASPDRLNYRILKDMLENFMEGYRWSRFGALTPLNNIEGIQVDPRHKLDAYSFYTRGSYENYINRLEATPRQLQEFRELCEIAIRLNRTSHHVSVSKVPAQIEKLLVSPENSTFYHPFKMTLDQMQLSASVKADLRARGRTAVSEILSTFRELKTFLQTEYIPNTRPGWGVGSLNHGRDYYKACLKWHLSTDMTPEEVHQIGLQEVQRIVGLMQGIMNRQNFRGSLVDYFDMLRNDSSLHMDTELALLEHYTRLINERINPRLSRAFDNLPDFPVVIERMPMDGVGARYIPGSPNGKRPGIFMVNVDRPREIGTYIMVPITLHESVPGHHLQFSYAMEANLPDFRRNTDLSRYFEIPFHFPFYTAYIEGWALYAESLGEELDLFQNDYELMGRYSSEIFRACRLVVDTGIHYYGWDRETAIQYMLNYTSFSREEMAQEVDRYITWPGQACAYKIGEIKIKELRQRAEDHLGSAFNIKAFHTVVLKNGPMPLSILEEVVDDWINNHNFYTLRVPRSAEHVRGHELYDSGSESSRMSLLFLVSCLLLLFIR